MLKIVKESNFNKEVMENELPILVDFYADWCFGPCRMIAPVLEKMGNEQTSFDIAKLNVDENQTIAAAYGVMSIPTMLIFKEGKVVSKLVGFMPEAKILGNRKNLQTKKRIYFLFLFSISVNNTDILSLLEF